MLPSLYKGKSNIQTMSIVKCQRLTRIAFMGWMDHDMAINRILLIILYSVLLSVCISWNVDAEESDWRIYDSDEVAVHRYHHKEIRNGSKSVVNVND
jgi:hypothetical protein